MVLTSTSKYFKERYRGKLTATSELSERPLVLETRGHWQFHCTGENAKGSKQGCRWDEWKSSTAGLLHCYSLRLSVLSLTIYLCSVHETVFYHVCLDGGEEESVIVKVNWNVSAETVDGQSVSVTHSLCEELPLSDLSLSLLSLIHI